MKVSTKTTTETTLVLNEREAELLAGLIDFPLHAEQPQEIQEFLTDLYEELPEWRDAGAIGYVDVTSF